MEEKVRKDIQAKVKELLTETLKSIGVPELDEKCTIQELGLNSFSYIRFITALENEFHIQFDDEYLYLTAFNKYEDIGDVIYEKMCNVQT